MTFWAVGVGLGLLLAAKPAAPAVPETAADAVTLRDGAVVLGLLAEPSARGPTTIQVRRAWAESQLPEWAKRWSDAERPEQTRARKQRRDRLASWKRERGEEPGGNDRISAWIERELKRLDDDKADAEKSAVMVVKLNRTDVKSIVRGSKSSARMLRQAWLSEFPNPETMKRDGLKSALEGRGFLVGRDEPVAIDRLLPIQPEPEALWLARRAATEVSRDAGLRFIKLNDVLIPEPEPDQPLNANVAVAALGSLAGLLGEVAPRAVSIADQLRPVADRGRVGAVVTEQKIGDNLEGAEVAMTLWVRNGTRWTPHGSQSSRVRVADLNRNEAEAIGDDPRARTVLQVFSMIGAGPNAEQKQAALNVAAAVRKALRNAVAQFNESLEALALRVEGEGGKDR